jgi:hypothetical protein
VNLFLAFFFVFFWLLSTFFELTPMTRLGIGVIALIILIALFIVGAPWVGIKHP